MTHQELLDSLNPGDSAWDDSAHRYKGAVRYEWSARRPDGILVTGHALTRGSARAFAEAYATGAKR